MDMNMDTSMGTLMIMVSSKLGASKLARDHEWSATEPAASK